MKAWKRILPILLTLVVLGSISWYLLVYDTAFTRDILVSQARFFEKNGSHSIATWLYDLAYQQSGNSSQVAIELAQAHKENGNYSQAEYTLSHAIAEGASVELYTALCQTYVEQNKLLDAVTMLDNVTSDLKAELEALRPTAPTATPNPGFHNQYISVSLESNNGTLYVSTNGEYPSIPEDRYTAPITLSGGETTLYAVCVGDNGLVSRLSVLGYTVHGVVEEVTLTNKSLETIVRNTLNIHAAVPLMSSDLWEITSLNMPAEITDYSDLKYFPNLNRLTIQGGSYENLQSLSSLIHLEFLTIADSDVTAEDLKVIAALPKLKELTLNNCMLSNIEALSNAKKLEQLLLPNNAIRDVTPLSNIKTLTYLDVSHNAIEDLSALAALEQLNSLDVSYNLLTSLSPLSGCAALTKLTATNNEIDTLPEFNNLTALKTLQVQNNKLTNIATLASCTSLETLNLAHNAVSDISPLSGLALISHLDFSYNNVTTLPELSKQLVELDGSHNQIYSLSALTSMPSLNRVLLSYNGISSVDALANCPNLYYVDVTGNPVRNVSSLTNQSITVLYTPM